MLQLLATHIGLTAFVAVVFYLLGAAPNWKDYFLGALLSGANLFLILWGIRQALLKKSFALTLAASVFKYGFLILLFWFATQTGKRVGYEFVVGILLMLPTTGYVTYELSRPQNDKSEDKT
jgi:hypothetical protein